MLLKNDGILPLVPGSRVALFGSGAGRTIKGGTGSGDVNEREVVSIYQGLVNAGFDVTSQAWIEEFEETYRKSREDWRDAIFAEAEGKNGTEFFQIYASHAYEMPAGRPILASDCQGAGTAVYVVSRIAGEGADRFEKTGDYYLTQEEKRDLETLNRMVDSLVVVLNVGAQIDVEEILSFDKVKALLSLIQEKTNYVVQEAIIVIRDIFRRYPNKYESIIGTLCQNLDTLDEPDNMEPQTAFIPFKTPGGHPEVVDTETYVDYLIEDEFSKNSSTAARRSSRRFLRLLEGGTQPASRHLADTGVSRSTYVGKHFALPRAAEA